MLLHILMFGEENNIWIFFNPALTFKIYSNDHWGKSKGKNFVNSSG